MNGLPAHVDIREVGPRDGFQNEPETIATADKIDLINQLARTGLRRIEVASFVRPDVIPQLSDGVEVLRGIDVPDYVSLMVLVPNSKGLDNALKVRETFSEVAIFVSASETHNKKNVNRTIAESMADNEIIAKRIVAEDLRCAAVIATSYGCPFEGKVPMSACSTSPSSSLLRAPARSGSATPPGWPIPPMSVSSSLPLSNGCPV